MGRYKHRVVCNVPRVTSPGGEVLRSLFGCGPGRHQLGFDFASLEARIQGHFVLPYTDGEALAESLIAEKPNDCFDTKTELLTSSGWVSSDQITDDTLIANWEKSRSKTITYTKPTDIIRRKHSGKMIQVLGERLDFLVTPNHRVVVFNRDINDFIQITAQELKEYVIKNPNSFIPANGRELAYDKDGNRVCRDWDSYLTQLHKLETVNTSPGSGIVLQSFDKKIIEDISLGQILRGSSARVFVKQKSNHDLFQTTIGKAPLNPDGFKLLPEEINEVDFEGDVWCVSVPSTYIIIRRNGKVSVSGNCHSINARKLGITRENAKAFSYA